MGILPNHASTDSAGSPVCPAGFVVFLGAALAAEMRAGVYLGGCQNHALRLRV